MQSLVSQVRTAHSPDREQVVDALEAATSGLDAPFAALHLPSLRANLADLRRRAGGIPIRVASKSVRCRHVLELALGGAPGTEPSMRGVMSFSVREALWLAHRGFDDILLGYPTADRGALGALAGDQRARRAVTLMVDDVAQLDLAVDAGCAGVRICLDVDASLRIGPLHLGVRRSPLRTPDDVERLARAAVARGFDVVGLMFYEAQVAGLPDTSAGIGLVKRVSLRRLESRRPEMIAALRSVTGREPEIVNSGGSGSVAESAAAPGVTEVAAGSGLYVPALFDGYRSFEPRPALLFALDCVRRPAPGISTLHYGGYVASGVPGSDRLPLPVRPSGLRMLRTEGAGEVQTPVRGEVPVGGRTWWRHAKAGELCERVDLLHLVDDVDGVPTHVGAVPTYRGEGTCFG